MGMESWMVMRLEEICEELLNIIPNIRWDPEGCRAIEEAVGILRNIELAVKRDGETVCRRCRGMTYNGEKVTPACNICPMGMGKKKEE